MRDDDNERNNSINIVTPLFMRRHSFDNCTRSDIPHDRIQILKIITKLHQNRIKNGINHTNDLLLLTQH